MFAVELNIVTRVPVDASRSFTPWFALAVFTMLYVFVKAVASPCVVPAAVTEASTPTINLPDTVISSTTISSPL